MKQSKKGITLVELVICCAILVLLGGACTAVLVSGQIVFNTSSKTANAQLDADVLQTYLMNLLPPAKNIKNDTLANAKNTTNNKKFNAIFFDNDNVFTLRRGDDFTTIQSIAGFQYNIVPAGETTSTSARAQLQYTITLTDGSEIKGGFVLANVKYDAVVLPGTGSTPVDLNGSAESFKAIIFDFEEPSTPEGGST